MTVSSTTNRVSYAGNDVTTAFSTSPVVFFNQGDLDVYLVDIATGVATPQTITTHYTVSGGSGSTGTVTMLIAPTSLQRLLIVRTLDITQEVDFVQNDPSDAEVAEDALDKLTMVLQQLDTRIDRSFVLPEGDTSGASTELPIPSASKLIGWNDTASALQNYSASALSIALTTPYTLTLLDDATAAAARATLDAQEDVITTKGDLITGTGTNTNARRAAPANGSILIADSSQASGYIDSTSAAARKNAIIGGDFSTNPWQRGTSFAAIANGAYCADRWSYVEISDAVHTVSQSADAPTVAQAGRLTNHCLLVDCTTADAAVAASDQVRINQNIEGYNFLPLAQRPMVLSFWHKHTKTGTYCVSLYNNGLDRSYVAEYTQAVSDVWEFSSIPILASPSAGTWNYTSSTGLVVSFILMSGTNFHTTAGAWQTGIFLATANQVNACDNVANNFRIALVQLEAGSVATEFEGRTFQEELELCQRYFEKSYDLGTLPGTGTGAGALIWYDPVLAGHAYIVFQVRKRVPPTMTSYSTTTGASGNYRDITSSADFGITFSNVGEMAANAALNDHGAVDELVALHWIAVAEL